MKGIKTGGRRKGTPNKTKVAERKAIAKSGLMPRDYMLKLMRDSKLPLETRLRACTSRSAVPPRSISDSRVDRPGRQPDTERVPRSRSLSNSSRRSGALSSPKRSKSFSSRPAIRAGTADAAQPRAIASQRRR